MISVFRSSLPGQLFKNPVDHASQACPPVLPATRKAVSFQRQRRNDVITGYGCRFDQLRKLLFAVVKSSSRLEKDHLFSQAPANNHIQEHCEKNFFRSLAQAFFLFPSSLRLSLIISIFCPRCSSIQQSLFLNITVGLLFPGIPVPIERLAQYLSNPLVLSG